MCETGVWVPYLGAVYDLNDNFSVYASYTTIFQPQDLQDESGRVLDPLRGDNSEVGLKGEFMEGRLTSSLAYFQLRQDNFGKESAGPVTPVMYSTYTWGEPRNMMLAVKYQF